jgi:hypothetical protein
MKALKILVACEESQVVAAEFRALGHRAFSCDLKPCSGDNPDWHLQMNALEAIRIPEWDLICMHPPCTYVSVTGNRHYAKGKDQHHKRLEAAAFVQVLWDLAVSVCDRVVMENPVGVLNSLCDLPKAQYIQPYEYGHPARKKTGLWRHGLPKLKPTDIVEPEIVEYVRKDGRKTTFSKDYMDGVDRSGKMKASTKRSKTYPGIAKAMARQYSDFIIEEGSK